MPPKKWHGGEQPKVYIDVDDSFTPVSVGVPKVKREPIDIGRERGVSPRKSIRAQQAFTITQSKEDEEEMSSDGDFLSSSDEYQPESESDHLESESDLWEESDDSEPECEEVKVELDIGQICFENGDKVMYATKSRKSCRTSDLGKKSRLSEKLRASCQMSLRSSGLRTRSNKVYASKLTQCKKTMKKKKPRFHENPGFQQNESEQHNTNVSPEENVSDQSMEQGLRNKSLLKVPNNRNFVEKEKVADESMVHDLRNKSSVNVQNNNNYVHEQNMADESMKFAVRNKSKTSPCIKTLLYSENITISLQRHGIKSETKTWCMYCGRNVLRLTEHLQYKHSTEMEVLEMNKFGKTTIKRRHILQQIWNEGLCRQNDKVLQTGKGTLIPVQSPVNTDGLTADQFCKTCYTFTDKNFLESHRLYCSRQRPEEIIPISEDSDVEIVGEEEDLRCDSIEISEKMIKAVNEKLKQVSRDGQITMVEDKKHDGRLMCAFCHIVPCHFSRHIEKKHSDEPIVRETLKHPKGSIERREGWTDIRNRFSFLHNKTVLERGRGELLGQYTRQDKDASQMEVCQFCYGLYRELQIHLKRCLKKLLLCPPPKIELICECMTVADEVRSGSRAQNGSVNSQTNDTEMTKQDTTEPSSAHRAGSTGDNQNSIKWQTRWNGEKNLLKKNCCFYCKQLKTKMYRHFVEKHGTEAEVQRALKYPKQSKEKREVFSKLIFKGNNEHNKRILQLGRGTLIPPRKLQGVTGGRFSYCPICFSRVRPDGMWMHRKRQCRQKLSLSQERGEHKSDSGQKSISSLMMNEEGSNTAEEGREDSTQNDQEGTNLISPVTISIDSVHLTEKRLSSRQMEENESSRQMEENESSRAMESVGSRQVEEGINNVSFKLKESFGNIGMKQLEKNVGNVDNKQVQESMCSRQVEESMGSMQVKDSVGSMQVEESMCSRQVGESMGSMQVKDSMGSMQVEESMCSRQVEESMGSRHVEESMGSMQVKDSVGSMQMEESMCSMQVEESMCSRHVEVNLGSKPVELRVGSSRQMEENVFSVLNVDYGTGDTERGNYPGSNAAGEEGNDLAADQDDEEKTSTEYHNKDPDNNIIMVKKKNKEQPYLLKHNADISILLSLGHSFCLYCQQPRTNIIKHLEVKHCEEKSVEEAIRMPREFEAGKKLWNDLILQGNKEHNDRVMQAGCGDLVPLRRIQNSANIRDYEFCFTCYLFVKKTDTAHKFFCESSRQTFDDTEEENLRICTVKSKKKCFCKSKRTAMSSSDHEANGTQNYHISTDGAFNFDQTEKSGRRKLQKSNCCVYCQTLVTSMARHLKLRHSNEMEVQKALEYPRKSEKRRQLFKGLLRRGNYDHNRRVSHLGKGFMIPVKLYHRKVGDLGKYTHCDVCFGLYTKSNIRQHKQIHRDHQLNGHLSPQLPSIDFADENCSSRRNSHRAVREKMKDSIQKHNHEMDECSSDESDLEWDTVDYKRLQKAKNRRLQKCKRSHEEDQTQDNTTEVKRKRKARKGATLWSDEELAAVMEHFSGHIKELKVPGKEQCMAAKEKYVEALRKRDWKSIKFCVYNKIQTKKKQVGRGKEVAKRANKQPWSQPEVCAVEKHMQKFITNSKIPGKLDCLQVKRRSSPALKSRTWQQIKYYVYNRVLQNRKMGEK